MGIKTFNPYTPSRRQMSVLDKTELTATKPEKSLTVSLKKNAGRNAQGKITVRHRGGGSRRKYRIIDFKRNKDGIPAIVKTVEYDPNRTANIALVAYADGEKRYILAPEGLKVGQKIMNGPEAEIAVGNCLPLENIPVGTQIHNIELHPGKGGHRIFLEVQFLLCHFLRYTDQITDRLLNCFRRDVVFFIIFLLDPASPFCLVDRIAHGIRNLIRIHDNMSLAVTRRTSNGLDQGCLRT